MMFFQKLCALLLLLNHIGSVSSFSISNSINNHDATVKTDVKRTLRPSLGLGRFALLMSSPNENSPVDGVVELLDEEETKAADEPKGPDGPLFISQGEIDENALNPDLSDPKQTRVIIYTILSLLPVLFLIPLMLSREFLPAIMQMDELPPVDMNM